MTISEFEFEAAHAGFSPDEIHEILSLLELFNPSEQDYFLSRVIERADWIKNGTDRPRRSRVH